MNTNITAGVDEVGRGPWAGPVVTAAVILPPSFSALAALNDSKKLSAAKRNELSAIILRECDCSIAQASVQEIDTLNIRGATLLAMRRALEGLRQTPQLALIDGRDTVPNAPCPTRAIIGGDGSEACISAASIIAKVYRDELMSQLAQQFPHFGWETNAGYGTATHQAGLAQFGVTEHHRASFAPIKKLLAQAA